MNGPKSLLNETQGSPADELVAEATGPGPSDRRRAILVVLLLWVVQFLGFSIDRYARDPTLIGWGTFAARLIVTGFGLLLSLMILAALRRTVGRSFLVRSVLAFALALAAATLHALVNVTVFRLALGPLTTEPLGQELALTLPPLVFFFSWVHLAIAVVLLSLTYGQEFARKERRLAEVATQLGELKRLYSSDDDAPHLWVRSGGQRLRVDIAEIDWIGAEGEYVRLHLANRCLLERRSLGDLEQQLSPLGFLRIHRSAIVNRRRVQSLERTAAGALQVRLVSGEELRVGKSFRSGVRQLLADDLPRAD